MLSLVLSSLTRDANGRSKRLVLQLGSRIAHAIRVDHLKPGAGIGRGAGDGVPRCGMVVARGRSCVSPLDQKHQPFIGLSAWTAKRQDKTIEGPRERERET